MNWKSFIAFRFFRSKKNSKLTNLISYISIITTFFFVAFLMLIFAMLRGFQQELINKIIDNHGFLSITSEYESFDSVDPKNIISTIGENQFEMQEEITNQAMISNENGITFALVNKSSKNVVKAIVNKDTIKKLQLFNSLNINIGALNALDKTYPLVIDALEQKSIIFPIIYLNEENFQKIFNMKNQVNSLKVSLKSNSTLTSQELETKIKQIKAGLPNLKVTTWKEMSANMLRLTDLEKKVFYITVALLIFMCAMVNFLAITMFIFSKKDTIRILKTQHANRMDIVSIFTQYNAILAAISIIFGLILGYLLCLYINTIIYFLEKYFNLIMHKSMLVNERIHIITNPGDVVLIFFSNFFSMILSAIIMSWKMYSIEFF